MVRFHLFVIFILITLSAFECIHFPPIDDMALYESLRDYALTEERLIESNYPVQHPEKLGSAVLFADNKKGNTDRE